MNQRQFFGERLAANAILLVVTAIILGPLLLLVNVSLKSDGEMLRAPVALVQEIHWDNYATAWKKADMSLYFKNSVLLTVGTVLATCFLATLAAFPLARGHFRGSGIVFLLYVASLFMPIGLVPMVFVMKYLGFMNTYYGFILLKTGSGLALAIIIFTGFIRSVPRELDDAAMIDGSGYLRYIFAVVFPLIVPASATIALLVSINVWNDFINPFLFMTDKEMRPLTAGLYLFFGQFSVDWTILAAGIIMVASPIIVAFAFLQRFIIAGATQGAIKG